MIQNRQELAKYFAQLNFTRGAEIGVYKGYFSKVLLENIPNLELLCVDNWADRRRKRMFFVAKKELEKYSKAIIIRKNSIDAAKDIKDESLDFVFIDACHEYNCVKEDINVWIQKIKLGGIISGHDYCKFKDGSFGVIQAVDEYVQNSNYQLQLINRDQNNIIPDDRQSCWWFVRNYKK